MDKKFILMTKMLVLCALQKKLKINEDMKARKELIHPFVQLQDDLILYFV